MFGTVAGCRPAGRPRGSRWSGEGPRPPQGPSGYPNVPHLRSRYCSGCRGNPIDPELRIPRLRYAVAVLSRRWAQPSLFPGLVERVMVKELTDYLRKLAELEAADEKGQA